MRILPDVGSQPVRDMIEQLTKERHWPSSAAANARIGYEVARRLIESDQKDHRAGKISGRPVCLCDMCDRFKNEEQVLLDAGSAGARNLLGSDSYVMSREQLLAFAASIYGDGKRETTREYERCPCLSAHGI